MPGQPLLGLDRLHFRNPLSPTDRFRLSPSFHHPYIKSPSHTHPTNPATSTMSLDQQKSAALAYIAALNAFVRSSLSPEEKFF